jgi:hypothetical protein
VGREQAVVGRELAGKRERERFFDNGPKRLYYCQSFATGSPIFWGSNNKAMINWKHD